MNIFYKGVEFSASFLEFFLLYKIYGIILCKYRKRMTVKHDIIVALIGTCIMQLCNYISFFSYITMLVFVLYSSITALFIYKVNYVELFSLSSFYMLCISCVDFLVFTLVSNFFGGYETFINMASIPSAFRMTTIVGIKCFWVLVYLFIRKYLERLSMNKKSIYTFLIIAFIGFIGFIYLVNQTFESFQYSMTGFWFLFVVFFSLVIFMIYFIFEFKEEKMKLNFAEMRNELLEENYNNINEIYMNNAKLYHDLNNHLNVLYQLLENDNVLEAKSYIKEISKPITQLSKSVWTGVDVVDVIINSKLKKMEEKGIEVEINVEFPNGTNVRPHDICTILSNLLDNAIEAMDKVDGNRKVELIIRRINHFLMIKISNSIKRDMMNFVKFPSTSKDNKELHGWGLPSVRDTVEKYDGSMKCTKSNEQFIVTIMLFYERG